MIMHNLLSKGFSGNCKETADKSSPQMGPKAYILVTIPVIQTNAQQESLNHS